MPAERSLQALQAIAKPLATRRARTRLPRPESAIEAEMALQLRLSMIPHAREYPFAEGRRWRFDFTVGELIAIECEGGTWNGGRHTRGSGFEADCEKYNEAVILGWRVLRVTASQVKSGQALAWVKRALSA